MHGKIVDTGFLSDNSVELLKWLALVSMTADHFNRIVMDGRVNALFEFGRLALPLFCFVLAWNLARPGMFENGAYFRIAVRLGLTGLVSTPLFIVAFHGKFPWLPFNVMFLLCASVCCIWIIERRDRYWFLAVTLFVICGALVETFWIGMGFCITAWYFCKRPNALTLAFFLLTVVGLALLNGSYFTFAALPLLYLVRFVKIRVHRIRYFFYIYYPLHLAIFLFIRETYSVN